MSEPRLGDRCACMKLGVWLPHQVESDCVNPCTVKDCRSLMMPLTQDELKKALTHFRDHVTR